jgi:hypothetical protein
MRPRWWARERREPDPAADVGAAGVAAKLSTLDRLLAVWIVAAMVIGLLSGRLVPGLGGALHAISLDGVSLPIAFGLLVISRRHQRPGPGLARRTRPRRHTV